MREVLKSLAALEGPKSVILISEGLVLEGLEQRRRRHRRDRRRRARQPRRDAARRPGGGRHREPAPDHAARGSRPAGRRARVARRPVARRAASHHRHRRQRLRSASCDRSPATTCSASSRGRAIATAGAIASRSSRTAAAPRCYSRRGFLAPTVAGGDLRRPMPSARRCARRSRSTTCRCGWRRGPTRSRAASRVRLLITAEIERSADQSLDYTAGLVVIDRNNKAVASNVEKRTLAKSEIDPARAVFAGSVLIEPGNLSAAHSRSPTAKGASDRSSARSTRGR